MNTRFFRILIPAVLLLIVVVTASCSSTVFRVTGPTTTVYGVELTNKGKTVQGWARIEYIDSTGNTVILDSAKVTWQKIMTSNPGDHVHIRAVNLSNCCNITVTIDTRGLSIGQESDTTGRGAVAISDGTVAN